MRIRIYSTTLPTGVFYQTIWFFKQPISSHKTKLQVSNEDTIKVFPQKRTPNENIMYFNVNMFLLKFDVYERALAAST
jgi:hypothetical protein